MGEVKQLSKGVFIIDDRETALNFIREGMTNENTRVIAVINTDADMDSILDLGLSYITNGSTIKSMFAPKPTKKGE